MNGPPDSGTWTTIDRIALGSNLQELQRHLANTELCMVVKGNAYGHGYGAVVPIAEAAGVRRFAVFSAREAAGFLRASDGKSKLMVMGQASKNNLRWMLEHNLQPWLNDPADWPSVRDAASRVPDTCRPARVHLEVETGMNRTGLDPDVALETARHIADAANVELEGVCTHLAGAEDIRNMPRIELQKTRFAAFLDALTDAGIRPNVRHMASSSAALLDPSTRLDMVRVGIACYGLWPSREVHQRAAAAGPVPRLANVLSWHSRIIAIKNVPSGDFVGYGSAYEAEGDERVAVVAVGYADGFSRDLSNRGHVLIRGKRASILGNVNMSMTECRITHIPEARVGDEVTLIGRQGEREISVSSFSDFNQIVNYEMMSRLSWEIPRIVVDGPNLILGAEPHAIPQGSDSSHHPAKHV